MSTVSIVDDDDATCDSLTLLLQSENLIVQCYADAATFLRSYRAAVPECLVLDLQVPDINGLELQQELSRRDIRVPIIFLSGHGDIPSSVNAIKGGALDFLTKPVQAETFLQRVHAALRQSAAAAPLPDASKVRQRLAELSKREREVLRLAVAGLRNKDIARRLGISHRTVEVHRAHLLHKTGATSLLQLARFADIL